MMMHGLANFKFKIHMLCSTHFFTEIRYVFEIIWKNVVKPDRTDMTI